MAIDRLLSGLSSGQSILASHDSTPAIRIGAPQDTISGPRLYCQSSGSRGRAKTIRRSFGSWMRSFEVNEAQFALNPADSYGVLGAISHSLSLYAIIEALHVGADLHLMDGLAPNRQFRALQDGKVSVLYATPSQLRLLLDGASYCEGTLSALRLVLSGGGKLDSNCREGLEALCPHANIFEFYGASETSFITLANEQTPIGSVGQPYPEVELEIRDSLGAQTHGVGEIWVKSPYLFEGYGIASSEASHSDTAMPDTYRDTVWRNGFLSVGEMGFLDNDGNLFLKGRKSRMVTVADQNVFLEDVEAVIQIEGQVRLCAVLARPDDQRGHALVAIVEPGSRTRGGIDLIERIRKTCRTVLGPHSVPREILFMDAMPRLPSGKPDLMRLESQFEANSHAHVPSAETKQP